eukprot:gnl/MRDRNA2_/MRDRNA2_25044_c0_seq1.p1 gnl/MRDRNA2_/MRDRNA2_25044_c0~~gnl/MRDRNA2_/MRDRNA2_25044_c0_seq1.p1  ORF type:complete len:228 (+),score=35.23 gnl/MRDRNA2_/MRDRNA2_25044_c0_seq1:71-754(+)
MIGPGGQALPETSYSSSCVRHTFLEPIEDRPVLKGTLGDSDLSSQAKSSLSSGSFYEPHLSSQASSSTVEGDVAAGQMAAGQNAAHVAYLQRVNQAFADGMMTGNSSELPSVGSALHGSIDQQCRPCCFFLRKKCVVGKDCTYCHLSHERQQRARKKSRERARRRNQQDSENTSQDYSISSQGDSVVASDETSDEWRISGEQCKMSLMGQPWQPSMNPNKTCYKISL